MGVIIGITAGVGMTSRVRGFDRSLRAMIAELGPNTIFVAKFSGMSFMSGKELIEDLIRRPNLGPEDSEAVERLDVMFWGGIHVKIEGIHYRGEKTKPV